MYTNFGLSILNNIKKKIVYFVWGTITFVFPFWRGARVVMEQIANLSTCKRCQGSNPCLSAIVIPITFEVNVLGIFTFIILWYLYGKLILKP